MTADIIRRVLLGGLGLGAAYALSRQCRKPAGWLGRRLARTMNFTHGGVTAWGLEHVAIEPQWRILDVGCGGGQTLRRMADLATAGRVDGVDYAPASVDIARQTNADLIEAGRASVQQASVSKLPFADNSFDLATAVETHYYWPDLPNDVREVLRVLKPGGRFVLIAETYRGRRMDWLYGPAMRLLLRATYLSLDEHRALLTGAGFANVAVDARPARGWMCAMGHKPN